MASTRMGTSASAKRTPVTLRNTVTGCQENGHLIYRVAHRNLDRYGTGLLEIQRERKRAPFHQRGLEAD